MAPNVPNVPGVPPLLRPPGSALALPILLEADGASVGQQFPSRWGVFRNGKSVILFDTFVSIDYRQGWVIADFPLEQGAFESYDKVATPFDVRVKFAAGESIENRQSLLQSVAAIAKDLNLYDVVTPEAVYTSVNVQHYDYRRTATNGNGLIVVEMWLLEVRISGGQSSAATGGANATNGTATNAEAAVPFTAAPPLTNTFDPSGMSSFNAGIVQGNVLPPGFISPNSSVQ